MAIHSSILAWRIPWTEESGGLQSKGHKEWAMLEYTHLCFYLLNLTILLKGSAESHVNFVN